MCLKSPWPACAGRETCCRNKEKSSFLVPGLVLSGRFFSLLAEDKRSSRCLLLMGCFPNFHMSFFPLIMRSCVACGLSLAANLSRLEVGRCWTGRPKKTRETGAVRSASGMYSHVLRLHLSSCVIVLYNERGQTTTAAVKST